MLSAASWAVTPKRAYAASAITPARRALMTDQTRAPAVTQVYHSSLDSSFNETYCVSI